MPDCCFVRSSARAAESSRAEEELHQRAELLADCVTMGRSAAAMAEASLSVLGETAATEIASGHTDEGLDACANIPKTKSTEKPNPQSIRPVGLEISSRFHFR
jgi:hypothetical protein